MFRIFNSRIATGAGRLALLAVLLGLAGTATIARGASKKAPTKENAPAVKNERAWHTQAYSKTSEFAQRLMLLEFSDKDNPACEPTTKLVDEMRRKNYPIQRVERAKGGDVLFKQYGVKTVPTFVLLFDGKELGRVVVKKDDVSVTTKRLLTLFQKGRDAVAANPRVRAKEPAFATLAKPARGLLFPRAILGENQARAQASDASADSAPSVETEVSFLETRAEEISNIIGEARLEAAIVRIVVKDPDGTSAREGVGSVIHYNSQYREALTVVAASLFTGIADPTRYPDVVVEIFNAESGKMEKSGAQCVRCDPDAGVAFVAAQVETPVKPVAFLPKKAPLEPSERAVSFSRHDADVVKAFHDVLAVDQRRFYENDEDQSAYVSYVEVSNPPKTGDLGAGLYVLRNGRFYFAGLFVSNGQKGRVVPATVVSQALLVNRNLTTVYRDQIANKFDAPATDAEIDSAIDRLLKLDAQKKSAAPAKSDAYAANSADSSGVSVTFSAPASSFDESQKPEVALESKVPNRAESALADVTGLSSEQSNLGDFPSNAKDAFARSDAMTNSIAANSSFQLAESFQQTPEENADPVEAALADADKNRAPADGSSPVEDPSATRTQLAFNDRQPLPETNATEQPVAANETAKTAPAAQNDANDASSAPLLAANEPQTNSNDAPFPDPLDAPLPDPQDSLLAAETPSATANEPVPAPAPAPTQSTALESAPLPARADASADKQSAQLVASSANPGAATNPISSPYADDALPTPNSDLVRSVTFSNREQLEAFNREEEQFETALDALRRRGMEGAEIICIVNWPDASGVRETEVVRLPKRAVLTNPTKPGAGVELARTPEAKRTSAQTDAPLSASRPEPRVFK